MSNIPNRKFKTREQIDNRIKELLSQRKTLQPNVVEINSIIDGKNKKIVYSGNKRTLPKKITYVDFVPKQLIGVSGPFSVFKHSGDIGDLIYSLPVIKYCKSGELYLTLNGLKTKKIDGSASGFSNFLIDFCTPLLEAQPYIRKVGQLNGQNIKVDLDYFRHPANKKFNLCEKILYAFSVPFSETNNPWVFCDPKKVAKYVFARSFRYRNENVNYKKMIEDYGKDAVFVGLPEEHKDFQERFGIIDYYPVSNLLEMAEVINGSELFVGNQSSPMALAIAMHKNFIQECFPEHADCCFARPNAQYIR